MSYNSIPPLTTDLYGNLNVNVAAKTEPTSSLINLTTLNQVTSYSSSVVNSVVVSISSLGVNGAVSFQASNDGGITYNNIIGIPIGGGVSVTTTSLPGAWKLNLIAYTNFQVVCIQSPTSGSITGTISTDDDAGVISIDNLPNTQNIIQSGIIVPASNYNIQYSGSTSGSAVTAQIQPGGLYSIAVSLPSLSYPNATFAGGITLSNGSPSASFGGQNGLFVGQVVLGNNIPASTYIKILNSNSLVLSANSTGNVTGSNNEIIQGFTTTGATPTVTALNSTGTSGNTFITMPAGFVAPAWMGPGTYIQGAAGIPATTAITSISGTQINLSTTLSANVLVTTLLTFTTNTFYGATGTSTNTFITWAGTPPASIQPGQNITGTSIPANTYITSIVGSTVNISAALTGAILVTTALTVNFNLYLGATANFTAPVGQTVLTWNSVSSLGGISVGQVVGGTGIAPGTYVTYISGNTIGLSLPITAAITATTGISFNAGNFTGVFEASVENQIWTPVNVIPKTVIGNNLPTNTTSTIGLYTFQDQTNRFNFLRFRITTLNSIPYVAAWIDAIIPNKIIHIPYIAGLVASATAFTIPSGIGLIPPIECSDLSEINFDATAFAGTGQTITWLESGDPLLASATAMSAANINAALWSWGITATSSGQYKITPHAPYFIPKLTYTSAITSMTIGSVTARIGPMVQQDSTNIVTTGNANVNVAQFNAGTPATATGVTNKLLGMIQGIPAGSVTGFLTSQTNKATQANPYPSTLTASDVGLFVDMYLMITSATTGTAAVVSSISTTTGIVTTSTPHGYQIGQLVTFSAFTGTGFSTATAYFVTLIGYSPTTFTLSSNQGGPVIIPTAFTSATITTTGIAKVVIQDTIDGGISYFDTYHSEYFWFGPAPTTQKLLMKNIPLVSGKPQALVYLFSGVTPNTPTAISYQLGGLYRPNGDAFSRQFIDNITLNPNISTIYPLLSAWTSGGNTSAGTNLATSWNYSGCKNFTLTVVFSYLYPSITTFPVYGIRLSQDGLNWWDSGVSLPINASNTTFGANLINTGPITYAQPYIKVAAIGTGPTIASAATTTITFSTPHNLLPGMVIMFSNVGSLTNVSLNTYYWVLASNWTTTTISIASNYGTGGAISVGTTVGTAAIYPCSQLYATLKGQS